MPFKVFRRHQRKMLAALAILAMFAFVLADSLPRLFQGPAGAAGADPVVATVYGRNLRQSDLIRLKNERGAANFVLSQLQVPIGVQGLTVFGQRPFGDTSDEAIVDAYILERKADELGLPATPEIGRRWIYDQAEQVWNELRRQLSTNSQVEGALLPRFDESGVGQPSARDAFAEQFRLVFEQTYGREMTDVAFLSAVANQVRILQALQLLSQAPLTPLDAYESYSEQNVRVEAEYVAFPVEDFLDDVPEPDDDALRAVFEDHKSQLPDPATGTVGFRWPRRIKLEYLSVGLEAIAALEAMIRERPIADEIRKEPGFREEFLEFHRAEAQTNAFGDTLPVDLFAGDPEAELTPPPASAERRYVERRVDERVRQLLREELEILFEPVKLAMDDFIEGLGRNYDDVETGLEPSVDRESLPRLDEALEGRGQELAERLGSSRGSEEGIIYLGVGLTRALADLDALRTVGFLDEPPPPWVDYFELVKIDWGPRPLAIARNLEGLVGGVEGLEPPDQFIEPNEDAFLQAFFDSQAPLFEPREFTGRTGRRYLVWKTLDIPERERTFESVPRETLVRIWKREQARQLARDAAEALAERVREAMSPTDGEEPANPAVALEQAATELGKSVQITRPRVKEDPLELYAPINAGEEVREAIFNLDRTGPNAALVAPDRGREIVYAFALASRDNAGAFASSESQPGSTIDYKRALRSLEGVEAQALLATRRQRAEAVMAHLREEAGLEWHNQGRSGG